MKSKKINTICAYCGKSKMIAPSLYKLSENHYCTRQCYGLSKRQPVDDKVEKLELEVARLKTALTAERERKDKIKARAQAETNKIIAKYANYLNDLERANFQLLEALADCKDWCGNLEHWMFIKTIPEVDKLKLRRVMERSDVIL